MFLSLRCTTSSTLSKFRNVVRDVVMAAIGIALPGEIALALRFTSLWIRLRPFAERGGDIGASGCMLARHWNSSVFLLHTLRFRPVTLSCSQHGLFRCGQPPYGVAGVPNHALNRCVAKRVHRNAPCVVLPRPIVPQACARRGRTRFRNGSLARGPSSVLSLDFGVAPPGFYHDRRIMPASSGQDLIRDEDRAIFDAAGLARTDLSVLRWSYPIVPVR
jgi:hypothetical protein